MTQRLRVNKKKNRCKRWLSYSPPRHPGLRLQYNSSEHMIPTCVTMGMHVCIWVCVHIHWEGKELSQVGLHACLYMRKLPLTKHWPEGSSDCAIITGFEPEILLNLHVIQPCNTAQHRELSGRMSFSSSFNIILSIQRESSFWFHSHQNLGKNLQDLAPS